MVEMEQLRALALDGGAIAEGVGVSRATVARSLGQLGLARLGPAEPVAPARRYSGRNRGNWCIWTSRNSAASAGSGIGSLATGAPRRASVGSLSTSASTTAPGWPTRKFCPTSGRSPWLASPPALTWFARRGVVVQRILTDNGSAYRSRLLAAFCRARRLSQRFTRPYTPRTNGKAERFIQTLLREWAYAVAYVSSPPHRGPRTLVALLQLASAPQRPERQPPITRVVVAQDYLLRLHT